MAGNPEKRREDKTGEPGSSPSSLQTPQFIALAGMEYYEIQRPLNDLPSANGAVNRPNYPDFRPVAPFGIEDDNYEYYLRDGQPA